MFLAWASTGWVGSWCGDAEVRWPGDDSQEPQTPGAPLRGRREGALEISEADAAERGLVDGDRVRVVTPGGTAETVVAVVDTMRQGHIAQPNGMGVEHRDEKGEHHVRRFPNELTTLDWKEDFAGTPWRKQVPARLEVIGAHSSTPSHV